MIRALFAAAVLTLAAPAFAQTELSAAFSSLSAAARAVRVSARALQAVAGPQSLVSPGRFHPRPSVEALPENCQNLAVVSIRDGEISSNGRVLGRNASTFLANCDGSVAWLDQSGVLYRDEREVGRSVSQFDLSWYGSVLAWMDQSGELHRDGDNLGRVETWTFVKYTGDVVWKDSWGDLYRGRNKLGRAESYLVAARTADVAWVNGYGDLYKNSTLLGRVQTYDICDRTGDVAWLDSYNRLFKNGRQVADGVNQFTLREDGKLIWTDWRGDAHSA
jgi:hypothetical protein